MSFARTLVLKGVKQKNIAKAVGRTPAVISHFLGNRCGPGALVIDDILTLRDDPVRVQHLLMEDVRSSDLELMAHDTSGNTQPQGTNGSYQAVSQERKTLVPATMSH